MRKILFLIALLFAGFAAASAQASYASKEFVSSEGQTLNYRLLTPQDMNAKKKYPLVIFLHGAGERGDDNESQLKHGGQMFLNPVNQEKYPAYVIFPQCPKKSFWARPGSPKSQKSPKATADQNNMSQILKAVKELIDEYLAMPSVDRSRVYIMGLSMGGMATFDLASRYPETFAAAIPICGAADTKQLAGTKSVKWRLYHGDADPVVPVEASRAAYMALKEAGIKVDYIEFPGCGHASWTPAFNQPDFMEWLFKQKK